MTFELGMPNEITEFGIVTNIMCYSVDLRGHV